ncbi:MAG: ACT domain-containing protein [Clostridia bacterium]|nr:ACT domain-containing protein [Clostridia bacterium]
MTLKQLSVFVENRKGRLAEVLNSLKEHNVSILSMTLADTTEYGILRLIVNDPEKGCRVLCEAGFAGMLTDVLVIKIPHVAGSLQSILSRITEGDVSIEYMYGLSVAANDASVVMKTSDLEGACRVLREAGIATMTTEELGAL